MLNSTSCCGLPNQNVKWILFICTLLFLFIIISGVVRDDIFVRNDMWNGAYFWNREDLPDEWEGIFSFTEPELGPIVLPVTAKTDVF